MPCSHLNVTREFDGHSNPLDKWTCNVCRAEFYHLENLQQGKITMMEPVEPVPTLRDRFAIAVLTNLQIPSQPDRVLAEVAYRVADAMLEERTRARKEMDRKKGPAGQ